MLYERLLAVESSIRSGERVLADLNTTVAKVYGVITSAVHDRWVASSASSHTLDGTVTGWVDVSSSGTSTFKDSKDDPAFQIGADGRAPVNLTEMCLKAVCHTGSTMLNTAHWVTISSGVQQLHLMLAFLALSIVVALPAIRQGQKDYKVSLLKMIR